MSHIHTLVACIYILLTVTSTTSVNLHDSKYCHDIGGGTYDCDYKESKLPVDISSIENHGGIHTYTISNVKMRVRGRICSDVHFENSHVELKNSSTCLMKSVKLIFMRKTQIDQLPENAEDIVISNSEIDQLISRTLKKAEISDSRIQLLNISSPFLSEFTVRDTNITRLNHIDLPKGSIVTFFSSEIIAVDDDPFSHNGGVLELHNTNIKSTITLKTPEPTMPATNNTEISNSSNAFIAQERAIKQRTEKTGLEIAVAILSVAVAVLIVIQFVKFLKDYNKCPKSGRALAMFNLSQREGSPMLDLSYCESSPRLDPSLSHCEGCNCKSVDETI